MKLGVVGNCQASAIADCLSALIPAATVVCVDVSALPPGVSLADLAGEVSGCDFVFTQGMSETTQTTAGPLGPLGIENLSQRGDRIVRIPGINFRGFHPDMVYVTSKGKKLVGILGGYQSALSLAAFQEGFSASKAIDFFNAFVFSRLGYIDLFGGDWESLRQKFSDHHLDLLDLMTDVPAQFMHTVNHPVIELVFNLTRAVATRAGLVVSTTAAPPRDVLGGRARHPVYPEIARHHQGVDASRDFFVQGRQFSFADFIESSYALFRQSPIEAEPPQVARARQFLRFEVKGDQRAADVTAEHVRIAYRLILGREIESDELAERQARSTPSLASLRERLLRSQEFSKKFTALTG